MAIVVAEADVVPRLVYHCDGFGNGGVGVRKCAGCPLLRVLGIGDLCLRGRGVCGVGWSGQAVGKLGALGAVHCVWRIWKWACHTDLSLCNTLPLPLMSNAAAASVVSNDEAPRSGGGPHNSAAATHVDSSTLPQT